MDKKEYYKDCITKGVAQEVVKDVFRVDMITQEVIDTCMKCMIAIKNAQTADVRENVRGEWIRHDGRWINDDYYPARYECNQCHHFVGVACDKNFCPNCGADMRGES